MKSADVNVDSKHCLGVLYSVLRAHFCLFYGRPLHPKHSLYSVKLGSKAKWKRPPSIDRHQCGWAVQRWQAQIACRGRKKKKESSLRGRERTKTRKRMRKWEQCVGVRREVRAWRRQWCCVESRVVRERERGWGTGGKKESVLVRGHFGERASEKEREDAEEEMKWRLGGKKRNSLFPPPKIRGTMWTSHP